MVWRGLGILAAYIPAAYFFLSVFAFDSQLCGGVLNTKMCTGIANAQGFLVPAAGVCCTALVWWLGRRLNATPHELLDERTGRRVLLHNYHTFFFVPLQWWAIPTALMGCAMTAAVILDKLQG